MEYRLLGPAEVVTDDGRRVEIPGARLRGLLVILALDAGRVVSAERLIDDLWGDEPPQRAINALQQLVSKLRRTLRDGGADGDQVVTRPPGYVLAEPPESVDALRFERLLADGRALAAAGRLDEAATRLTDALGLWRGDALADSALDGETVAIGTRLRELRDATEEDRVDVELARGRHDVLVPELEAMVAATPMRERRWGQLMVALYRSGRQGDALRTYQQARRTLAEELGVEPGPELRRLEAAVLAHDDALAPPTASALADLTGPAGEAGTALPPGASPGASSVPARRPGRIRRPLTACLGRDAERARLAQLLEDHRLITLVGPGGTGKTRLATEVALVVDERFADGAWWVELAPVAAGGVVPAIAGALGLDEPGAATPEEGAAHLGPALAHRQAVLVLDNCEHVVDEVAVLVEELLVRAPDVRVLATSREGLAVAGEVLFPVPPLPLASAVDLFAERAEAGGVALTAADTRAGGLVAEICQRLDGLPLAVELAAARARHLGLADIAGRLDARFELLTGGPRTAQARQRTLRAVVDWSYQLLDETERLVFERLGVFASGARLESARSVCAGDGVSPAEVEPVLARLVDKSLVVADRRRDGVRYRLLQTLGDYAVERLRERGDEEATRRRHAEWVSSLAASVEMHVDATDRRARLAAVRAEDAELRHGLTWALTAEPTLALEIAARLGFFWIMTLHAHRGWADLSAALAAAPDAPADLRAHAQAFAGLAGGMSGAAAEAAELGDAAVAYERERGDPFRLGRACYAVGVRLMLRAQAHEAEAWLEEAEQCFREAADEHALAYAVYARGFAAGVLNDHDTARARLAEAEEAFRRQGDPLGLGAVLIASGDVERRAGDVEAAAAVFQRLQATAQGTAVVHMAGASLALLRVEQGRVDEARTLAQDAVDAARDGFSPIVAGRAHHARGAVRVADVAAGDPAAADGARVDLERAVLFYEAADLRSAVALARIELSRLAELVGDLPSARAEAEAAVAEARRDELVAALERAESRLAELAER
jgi:predicted ATPase/DNA-binding SARP family transcriptional activator